MSEPLDPKEAATLFFAGHPMAFVSNPTSRFVCGQWMGQLAYVTPIPFDDAEAYFADNPVALAEGSPLEPPPPGIGVPPVNVDAPYVEQSTDLLTCSCTMGNWQDPPPDSYSYQWRDDGVDIDGATSATYTITPDDIGQTLDCVLTATNAYGSTSSTSNSVVATAPARRR